ncbi:cell division protein FtsQ [Rhodobacteraceae bacterium CCMM004]|nr:cell division protein FtsQ [Rhodobacteraceae bacterium CCMM004]
MQQVRAPRDPAPSRLAYRMQRLALTPSFRGLMRIGLPLATIAAMGAVVLGDQARRDALTLWVADMKSAFQEREAFMVKAMAIDGASAELAADIREAVPVDFPISSFDLDLERMQRDVAALDAVARVDLRVRPGGMLQMTVVERIPALIWRAGGALELLDAGGHRVAELTRRTERADLPLVAGRAADAAAPEALELIAAAGPLAPRLRGLVRIGERRWDVLLDRGQRLKLPETGAVGALEQIIALDQAQDLLARDVLWVDMRNLARPAVRLRETAATTLRQVRLRELGVQVE